MRRDLVLAMILVGASLSGCDTLIDGLPPSAIECGGTERALCGAVARLAVAQMNLSATGPITRVTLAVEDCERLAKAFFLGPEARNATTCWQVDVTGERSHGGGVIILKPDGALEPYW
jgi:uncharacterized protein YwlG (UPF0340 family)